MQEPLVALLGCMVLALPAQALSLPLSLSLLIHCVGKANMAGAAPVAQTLVMPLKCPSAAPDSPLVMPFLLNLEPPRNVIFLHLKCSCNAL